jgi:hypothetical protein
MKAIRVVRRSPARTPQARARRGAVTVAALVAITLLVAACGASSPSGGVAQLGSSTPSTTSAAGAAPTSGSQAPGAQALKYSACMRSHGEPNFPDPEISQHGDSTSVRVRITPSSGIDPGSPVFKDAQQACRAFAPVEGKGESGPQLSTQEQAQVLQVVACVRKHGEPNLPDPSFAGGGVHLPPSVDTRSATFKAALHACESLVPSSLRAHGSEARGG